MPDNDYTEVFSESYNERTKELEAAETRRRKERSALIHVLRDIATTYNDLFKSMDYNEGKDYELQLLKGEDEMVDGLEVYVYEEKVLEYRIKYYSRPANIRHVILVITPQHGDALPNIMYRQQGGKYMFVERKENDDTPKQASPSHQFIVEKHIKFLANVFAEQDIKQDK